MLGERLGKGCGRERGGGFAGLRILGRERFEAVTSKTIGDEPNQTFHKGLQILADELPGRGATATRKFSCGVDPPEGSRREPDRGVATAITIHFGGMVSVMGGSEVSSASPLLFVVSAPLRGSG